MFRRQMAYGSMLKSSKDLVLMTNATASVNIPMNSGEVIAMASRRTKTVACVRCLSFSRVLR